MLSHGGVKCRTEKGGRHEWAGDEVIGVELGGK